MYKYMSINKSDKIYETHNMEEKKKKSNNNNFSGLLNNEIDDNNKKEKLKNSISKMYSNHKNRENFNECEKEDLVVIEEKDNNKKKKKNMTNTFEQDNNYNMNDNKRLGSFFKINDKCESINENINNINKQPLKDSILFDNINEKEYFNETKEENKEGNKSNDIEKINCIKVKKKTLKKNKKKINKIINNKNKISKSNDIEEQIINISKHIYKILNISKLPKCDILKRTNRRYAETFLYLTNGYNLDIEEIIKRSLYKRMYKNNSIIKVTGIHIYSLCKHHLLPFEGTCDIEYIPNKYIIGLSKFSRIVDVFSRRLQLQEDLTNDICNALKKYLKPLYIKVSIVAKHLCINMRGVKEHDAKTITYASYKAEKENPTIHSLNIDSSVENLN
ncbi:GTP cyclohydrolase I [Plasmodium reichenowi]|uniref:GTP cyclohydrolase 1 n=1 Tax=Plasmodium reichenowi TaxID=5854 RepID=A0A060RVW0_PLARE|nr:GTP cyclohydrolase I [Plasmodium reichenowi]SOV80677.1 GTP cyclohydrolase I [Plasmodium reichenowi]